MGSRIIHLIISFCLFTTLLHAQYTNLKFENLDTNEGLSSSTATGIYQDSDGFLWFGTIDGLNRYNGYQFKIFRPELNNPFSISNNRITSIVEDSNEYLWVGTNNGLNVFDKRTEKFYRIRFTNDHIESTSPGETINELLYDKEKNELWVGTKRGLIKLNLNSLDRTSFKDLNYSHYFNRSEDSLSIDNNNVTNLVKDKNNKIWVGTDGKNLHMYQPKTNNFKRFLIDVNENFELNQLPKQVLIDENDNFWIGNNLSNLVYWDRSSKSFKPLSLVERDIPIFDLYQDGNGVIWIATDGYGIYLYSKKNGLFQHIEHNPEDPFSLTNNQPSKVFEDSEGVFWIATYNKGVIKQVPAKSSFGHYFYQNGNRNGLSTKIAQSVMEDSKGRIWIGTDGGGLNLFNENNSTFEYFRTNPNDAASISSDKIIYLTESSDGNIWICTWDGGLSKFNPEQKKAINYQHDSANDFSIGQNTVWCAVEDSKQRLWVGTQTEGLNLFDPNTEKFYQFDNASSNLNSDFIFSLFIDSKNRLFIGTSGGLNYVALDSLEGYIPSKIDFKEVTHDNIRGNRINYITEDQSDNIWIGTDIGLYKLDVGLDLIRTYSHKNGLPNNLVVGIAVDNYKFWITTKSGLSLLNPNNHTFKNFNVHDGLQGTEFQSKSIERTKDGRIIVGGINGFNIFDPKDIDIPSKGVEPIITSFKLLNNKIQVGDTINNRILLKKPISELDKIVLKHNETYLAFDFVALNFQNPERVNYSYRMKGLDDNFINAGINRTANYSNLPPGSYTFEVRASIGEQWEEAKIATVNLEVLPPPWRTWWAYLIYTIFIILIVWFSLWYYSNKVKEEKEHELDQMKLRFFINVSHEFRTPLTLILNPIDKILSSYNDPNQVQKSALTIQRSARRLLYLINQLLDFRKMDMGGDPLNLSKTDIVKYSKDTLKMFEALAEEKNINFIFKSAYKEYDMYLDLDKYEKILTNLLSNSLKFTKKGGTVKLSISKTFINSNTNSKFLKKPKVQEYIQIKVEDTGIGFKKEQLKEVFSRFFHVDNTKTGTGIGLNFTKALVELHGGSITVESEYGQGSDFTVNLPVEPEMPVNKDNNYKMQQDAFFHNLNTVKSTEYEVAISDEDEREDKGIQENKNKEKPTVLLVEDNKELRNHLKNELKGRFIIKEAKNGSVGYDRIKKYYPDIVISDIMMPEMDGFELCRLIKTDFDTCHIPVILLTARSLAEDKIEGYKTGADEYLPKPFNIHILRARINNLLEARKRIREKFTSISGVAASSEITSNSLDEVFLDRVTKVIIENISDSEFTLDQVLKQIGIGRSQFYRKINSITGQNPSHFIRTIRLKYASELLLHSEYSIKEVSYMSGFNSSAYFSKTFKELYGLTPTQFLKEKHNKSS